MGFDDDNLFRYFSQLFDYIINNYHTLEIESVKARYDVSHQLFDRKELYKMLDTGDVSNTFEEDTELSESELDSFACFLSNILDIKGMKASLKYISDKLGLAIDFRRWYEPGVGTIPTCGIRADIDVDQPIPPDILELQDRMFTLFDRLMWTCAKPEILFVKHISDWIEASDNVDVMYVVNPRLRFPNLQTKCSYLPNDFSGTRAIGDGCWEIMPDPNPLQGFNVIYDESLNGVHGDVYPFQDGPWFIFGACEDGSSAMYFDNPDRNNGGGGGAGTGKFLKNTTSWQPILVAVETTINIRFQTIKEGEGAGEHRALVSSGGGLITGNGNMSYLIFLEGDGRVGVHITESGFQFPHASHTNSKIYLVGNVGEVDDLEWHTVGFKFDNGLLEVFLDGVKNPNLDMVRDDPMPTIYGLGLSEENHVGAQQFEWVPALNNYRRDLFFEGFIADVTWWQSVLTDQQLIDYQGRDTICNAVYPTPNSWWKMNLFPLPAIEEDVPLPFPENFRRYRNKWTIIGAACGYHDYIYSLVEHQECECCRSLMDWNDHPWTTMRVNPIYASEFKTTLPVFAILGDWIFYGIDGMSLGAAEGIPGGDPPGHPLGPVSWIDPSYVITPFGVTQGTVTYTI